MTCAALITALWLSLPGFWPDRHDAPEARAELYRPVAEAVCRVGRRPWERAWLAAQAWHETRLARHVLEERCHDGPVGMRCHWVDGPLSIGPWQVQRRWCPAAVDSFSYSERLEAGARYALRLARAGRARCHSWEGAFAHQAGRAECRAMWAARRVPVFYFALEAIFEGATE